MFCFDLKPHLSIYLDAPTNVRLARISGRAGADLDRFEEYGNAFETASSEKFRDCGPIIDDDFVSINADQTPVDVAGAVYHAIAQKQSGRAACRERFSQCKSRWSPYH